MSYLTTPDGVRLRVCERGSAGQTVVFVHGWKMSHRVFDHAILRLERDHRVIAFDNRGMGESDKPNSRYDFDELADDLGFVLSELGVEDATLVGWSMGCTISLRYLERGGGRVSRLVLVNGPIRLERTEDDSFPWSMSREVLEGYFSAIERGWPEAERAFQEESLVNRHPEVVDLLVRITQQTPLDVVLKVVRAQIELDFRALLPRLELPVLALYGRHDPYYPVELAEWIAQQCPRGESLIMEGSGHYPFLDEKDRFADVIADFARRPA